MSEKRCNNILVRGVNWIGDAVMTMPALRALRHSEPGKKIKLLVEPRIYPLFEKDPNVDEIILYKDEYRSITGKFRLANMLKKNDFCTAVLFQNAIDAAIITFLARIPERIGYSRDGRGLLLTKPVPFDSQSRRLHHIEYYLSMLDKAGFVTKYSLPWIYMSIVERLEAREMLKDLRQPVIALNPGATYGSSKRWHTERFAEVAQKVIDEIDGSIVILGGPTETGIAEEIIKTMQTHDVRQSLLNMAGRTELRELVALISECDVLVTNDSGPMHIGYAVGTPVVAIFGSTSPERTGPAGKGNIVISKELDCSPCFERKCKNRDLKCMDIITSGEVYEAVKTLIYSKRAVFFDRDGTLCRDAGYLNRMENLEIFPEINCLTRLKEKEFTLIGVSNQSGIARGLVEEDFVKQVNNIFIDKYGFNDFYYCPHHPDEHCSCRKPEPGLLLKARIDHNLNLKKSFVVGDKETDMLLAKSSGAKGIFVKTDQDSFSENADFVAGDIEEAVSIILENS